MNCCYDMYNNNIAPIEASSSVASIVESDIDQVEKPVIALKVNTLGKSLFILIYNNMHLYHTIPARPTITNLTLIEWINNEGEKETLRVKQSIWHLWKEIGLLLGISMGELRAWETIHLKDPRECINEVLHYWLESPNETNDAYPTTWEGLYKLLEDSELIEVALVLKQALESHNTR